MLASSEMASYFDIVIPRLDGLGSCAWLIVRNGSSIKVPHAISDATDFVMLGEPDPPGVNQLLAEGGVSEQSLHGRGEVVS
jgi:hypothetical protein